MTEHRCDNQTMALSAASSLALNTSRDGDSTMSPSRRLVLLMPWVALGVRAAVPLRWEGWEHNGRWKSSGSKGA